MLPTWARFLEKSFLNCHTCSINVSYYYYILEGERVALSERKDPFSNGPYSERVSRAEDCSFHPHSFTEVTDGIFPLNQPIFLTGFYFLYRWLKPDLSFLWQVRSCDIKSLLFISRTSMSFDGCKLVLTIRLVNSQKRDCTSVHFSMGSRMHF